MKAKGLFALPLVILTLVAAFAANERSGNDPEAPGSDLREHDELVKDARAALLEQEARHQRRFEEAVDPELSEQALQARLSIAVEQGIADEIVRAGFELFIRDRRITRPRKSKVEANRCASCHSRGGPGGAGGLVDNYFEGRNPPALAGAALLERLGQEITAELREDLANNRPLEAKGLAFGSVSAPQGIGKDLRIKPFGRGRWSTLDEAIAAMGTQAMGIDLRPAERTALRAWIATLPAPGLEPPDAARTPDLFECFLRGRVRFQTIGCATCHVPEIKLGDGTTVRAYTDLKFHDLGPELASGAERNQLTAPLWGLASTAPWLHDGSALASVEEAILAHGGEAEAARKAYEALDIPRRGELQVFLLSLAPEPKLQIAGQ